MIATVGSAKHQTSPSGFRIWKLLWHALGAKTIELIHDHSHLESITDDLDVLIMDADLIEAVEEAKGRANRISIKLVARLRGHGGDPKFVELGERLENLRERHEKACWPGDTHLI